MPPTPSRSRPSELCGMRSTSPAAAVRRRRRAGRARTPPQPQPRPTRPLPSPRPARLCRYSSYRPRLRLCRWPPDSHYIRYIRYIRYWWPPASRLTWPSAWRTRRARVNGTSRAPASRPHLPRYVHHSLRTRLAFVHLNAPRHAAPHHVRGDTSHARRRRWRTARVSRTGCAAPRRSRLSHTRNTRYTPAGVGCYTPVTPVTPPQESAVTHP